MKTITVWMKYEAESEIEVEVDDCFDPEDYRSIDDWPSDWLADLDAGIVENTPSDWGIKE